MKTRYSADPKRLFEKQKEKDRDQETFLDYFGEFEKCKNCGVEIFKISYLNSLCYDCREKEKVNDTTAS